MTFHHNNAYTSQTLCYCAVTVLYLCYCWAHSSGSLMRPEANTHTLTRPLFVTYVTLTWSRILEVGPSVGGRALHFDRFNCSFLRGSAALRLLIEPSERSAWHTRAEAASLPASTLRKKGRTGKYTKTRARNNTRDPNLESHSCGLFSDYRVERAFFFFVFSFFFSPFLGSVGVVSASWAWLGTAEEESSVMLGRWHVRTAWHFKRGYSLLSKYETRHLLLSAQLCCPTDKR